jgi:hypothetical protein
VSYGDFNGFNLSEMPSEEESAAALERAVLEARLPDHLKAKLKRLRRARESASIAARLHENKPGHRFQSTKPRRPVGMSGRQWVKARKALRAVERAKHGTVS